MRTIATCNTLKPAPHTYEPTRLHDLVDASVLDNMSGEIEQSRRCYVTLAEVTLVIAAASPFATRFWVLQDVHDLV